MKSRTLERLAYYGARAALVAVFVFWALYFFEPVPLHLTPKPFLMSTDIKKGDSFTFAFTRCADYRIEYIWNAYLEKLDGSVKYYLQAAPIIADKGCYNIISLPRVLPEYVQEGLYKIKYDTYVRGRLRTHYLEHETTEFFYVND